MSTNYNRETQVFPFTGVKRTSRNSLNLVSWDASLVKSHLVKFTRITIAFLCIRLFACSNGSYICCTWLFPWTNKFPPFKDNAESACEVNWSRDQVRHDCRSINAKNAFPYQYDDALKRRRFHYQLLIAPFHNPSCNANAALCNLRNIPLPNDFSHCW